MSSVVVGLPSICVRQSRLIRSSLGLSRRSMKVSRMMAATRWILRIISPWSDSLLDMCSRTRARYSPWRSTGRPNIFRNTSTGNGSATSLMNSQRPFGAALATSCRARARISSLSAFMDLGENGPFSGRRNLPCSGGSTLIGSGWGMCGEPGGSAAIMAWIFACGMNSLEKVSQSRAASKLPSWLITTQCPPLRGVQKIGGAVLTKSSTRSCGFASRPGSLKRSKSTSSESGTCAGLGTAGVKARGASSAMGVSDKSKSADARRPGKQLIVVGADHVARLIVTDSQGFRSISIRQRFHRKRRNGVFVRVGLACPAFDNQQACGLACSMAWVGSRTGEGPDCNTGTAKTRERACFFRFWTRPYGLL